MSAKEHWDEAGQVFYTGDQAWGVNEQGQTVCLGPESDVKARLGTGQVPASQKKRTDTAHKEPHEGCKHYQNCEAPLCPLQPRSVEHGVWYGDEEVCKARQFQSLPWVKVQKRIKALGLGRDDGLFTVRMLEALQAVKKGLKGADPNDFNSPEKWLRARKDKKDGQQKGRAQSTREPATARA